MAGPLTANVARMVQQQIQAWPAQPEMNELNNLLRLLGRWRSQVLVNTFIAQQGAKIFGGPFAGMEYGYSATEGALIPRLLGVYESELHPHLAAFAAEGLDTVIDVGCAEGYYAVGLARMIPEIQVYAYDIDAAARRACAEMAAKNGVADRVMVGGEFPPDGFEAFQGQRVLVVVDAEGAEVDILQPEFSPSLAQMNIIVETHDIYRQGATPTLMQRFGATHDITVVRQQGKTFEMPPWLDQLPHLDQLLAVWEWRVQPTPWLIMRPKKA